MATDKQARKFGPLRLVAGVTGSNMIVYYLATVTSLLLFTFTPQAQPFLLTELLGIAESEQGVVSGNLAFFAEIVILASIGGWGVLSDKFGRRLVFAAGFLLMGAGLYLQSTITDIVQLYIYRGFFALGAAAATTMIATVIADYIVDEDRGKGAGMQGIGNGLGALITVFLLLRLPEIFQNGGSTPVEAARNTYLIAAIIGLISAIAMWAGLQGPHQSPTRANQKLAPTQPGRIWCRQGSRRRSGICGRFCLPRRSGCRWYLLYPLGDNLWHHRSWLNDCRSIGHGRCSHRDFTRGFSVVSPNFWHDGRPVRPGNGRADCPGPLSHRLRFDYLCRQSS